MAEAVHTVSAIREFDFILFNSKIINKASIRSLKISDTDDKTIVLTYDDRQVFKWAFLTRDLAAEEMAALCLELTNKTYI
jgi:hypothetical protein